MRSCACSWSGTLQPTWIGVHVVLGLGALSVGGVVYALFQHDLKRLLALRSIEHIGIIVLGLDACLLLRSHGAEEWAAFALAAALLPHAQPRHRSRRCCSWRGRVRGKRLSSSLTSSAGCCGACRGHGGAFLVGAMAIAGLPP